MHKELLKEIAFNHHLGCFSNFDIADPICKRFCALSLRCAIESDQQARMEVLEDLLSSESPITREQ